MLGTVKVRVNNDIMTTQVQFVEPTTHSDWFMPRSYYLLEYNSDWINGLKPHDREAIFKHELHHIRAMALETL